MWPFNVIATTLKSIADYFYSIYLQVNGWVWPFYLAATSFFWVAQLLSNVSYWFIDVGAWANDVTDRISGILSWSSIWSMILSYVPNLTQIRDWFYSWTTNVRSVVTSWWSSMAVTVHGWIDAAVQEVAGALGAWTNFWNNLWPQFVAGFNSLKTAWDNFWSQTVPQLVRQVDLGDWWDARVQDVQNLINSAIRDMAPFWEGWQEVRNDVVTFFQDPLTWLVKKLEDWFWEGESE